MGEKGAPTALGYQLRQLRDYLAAVERFISDSAGLLPLSVEERARLREDPAAELEIEVGYEEFIETCDVFPEILRRSVFVFVLPS